MHGPKPIKFLWLLEAIKTHNSDACLIWPYKKSRDGYGRIRYKSDYVPVHRLAFFISHGRWPTPFGCHSCDVKACFNPRHIFEGTNSDNLRDAVRKGRTHPLSGEKHSQAKLTETLVKQIREEYRPGKNGYVHLAAKFGVCVETIHRIVLRTAWKHV